MIQARWLACAGAVVLSTMGAGCRRLPESQTQPIKPEALQETAKPGPPAQQSGRLSGHQATVRCLRGERAMTDGDELRCEDWGYVESNYDAPQ